MKIGIFGLGAMGSVYATFFAENGYDVSGFDDWDLHVKLINQNGLKLSGYSGDRVNKNIKAFDKVSNNQHFDLIIVSTKANGVKKAAESILPILNSDTTVITIQNGLGSSNELLKILPENLVLIGVADGFGASLISPGHAHHNSMKLIRLGEVNGGVSKKVSKFVKIWKDCGFNVKAYENIQQLLWEKFICNVSFSGPCSVYECTLGELLKTKEYWEIAKGCALEVYEIAKKNKIKFNFDNPIKYVKEFGERMPNAKPSMLLDHISKRKSEIDFINGMVVKLGKHNKIDTPFNFMITEIIKQKEKEFK